MAGLDVLDCAAKWEGMMDAVSLARGLRDRFGRLEQGAFLEDWPDLMPELPPERLRLRNVSAQGLPVCRWLAQAVAGAPAELRPLVQGLHDGAAHLRWGQTYGAQDFGAAFLDGYGWTELIGLRGPIASDSVAVGFLILGPGVDYPPHAHEAAEVYLPLSGVALWQRGDADHAPVLPGVRIEHESWVPHAMRTGAEPLVAAYIWRGGDLAAKSRIVT